MRNSFAPRTMIREADLVDVGDPLMIYSFGRSGTHLLIDLVRRQFPAFCGWKWPGEPPSSLYVPLDDFARAAYSGAHVRRTIARSQRTLVKSHHREQSLLELSRVQPVFTTWLEERAQTLVIVRDPIVAISKVWALINSWRQQAGNTQPLDPEQFIADEARRWAEYADSTATISRSLIVRLEDLLARPADEIRRIGIFIGEAPRFAQPLLIPPHRSRLQVKLARLDPRPMSTHIFLSRSDQRQFRRRWSAASLDLLDAVAGNSMARLGYRRQRPCNFGADRDACQAPCSKCDYSLQPCIAWQPV